jgi:hypothetical protein
MAATAALGATLGFLVPTMIGAFAGTPDEATVAPGTSQSVAREFLVAYLNNDQVTLQALESDPASALGAVDFARNRVTVVSITPLAANLYASSASFAYAVEVKNPDGTLSLLGFRVHAVGNGLQIPDPPKTTN